MHYNNGLFSYCIFLFIIINSATKVLVLVLNIGSPTKQLAKELHLICIIVPSTCIVCAFHWMSAFLE